MSEPEIALKEREKELDTLYALAELCARPGLRGDVFLLEAAAILRGAFRSPEGVRVEIVYRKIRVPREAVEKCPGPFLQAPIPGGREGAAAGEITAFYETPPPGETVFLDREKLLLISTGKLLGITLRRVQAERRGRRQYAALREVLVHIEGERRRLLRENRGFIQSKVVPLVRRIIEDSGDAGKTAGELLFRVLEHLPGEGTAPRYEEHYLSPRETEICGLVRGGMSSKEIAGFLGLSESTVERHRHNIRGKIGIRKEVPLASFLNRRDP